MKTVARKLEELFLDITFAEDREFTSAKEALRRISQKTEDTFVAIAFAEAGEHEAAARYINKGGQATGSSRAGYRPKRFTRLCTGRT